MNDHEQNLLSIAKKYREAMRDVDDLSEKSRKADADLRIAQARRDDFSKQLLNHVGNNIPRRVFSVEGDIVIVRLNSGVELVTDALLDR